MILKLSAIDFLLLSFLHQLRKIFKPTELRKKFHVDDFVKIIVLKYRNEYIPSITKD